jgi:maleate isomerase
MTPPLVGLVVPSSNPTIERFLAATDVRGALGIDVVVTRLSVTQIRPGGSSAAQFSAQRLGAAAGLLSDAEVDLVLWAGTSGFWLAAERSVLDAVWGQVNTQVSSSREAMLAALTDIGATRIGVFTPYLPEIHSSVLASFEGAGFDVTRSLALHLEENLDFSRVSAATIDEQVRLLAGEENVPVCLVCTNMLALVSGPVVVDSVVATLWHAARLTGATTAGYRETYAAFLKASSARPEADPHSDAGPALESLRIGTGADRATLRLDVPGMNFPCVAESCGSGVRAISADNSLDQAAAGTAQWIARTHRVLVQPDLSVADPAPPQALLDTYGVRAQMLAPVVVAGELTGWISLHSGTPRAWTPEQALAIEMAAVEFGGRLGALRGGHGYTQWLTSTDQNDFDGASF